MEDMEIDLEKYKEHVYQKKLLKQWEVRPRRKN